MKRFRNYFLRMILLLIPCVLLALSGAPSEAAVLEQYCQYPPYVVQTVLPSVTMLVSNSQSMLNFAYGDGVNGCNSSSSPCGGFDPNKRYYGLFDSNYWYTGATGSSGGFTKATLAGGTLTAPTGRGGNDWHGNFLNWLTTRRVDVMRKVLTGGTGNGTESCGANGALYKKFSDDGKYTPVSGTDNLVTFNHASNCSGTLLSDLTIGSGGGAKTWPVRNKSLVSPSGIIQEVTPKASLGIAFYNESDSNGANINPQVDGGNLALSAYRTRIDTPSNFNGMTAGQPLGEALWTIVGQYATIGGTSSSGPRYHLADYVSNKDPYFFHTGPSRCVKGSVIIISDGEPCNDGNLPTSYAGFDILNYADKTSINCRDNNCLAAPDFSATTIPACGTGGNVGGLEDVALFAHTTDLRSETFGGSPPIENKQNLDIYVIRAFGTDNSNLLKYAAINGSFDDRNGNGVPDPGEYSTPGTNGSAYFPADDGSAIEQALRDIFVNILKRATSGTAASVLASGEGSGANLVQAVFYPRRRFFDEVVEWTGTLTNLWYYVDPFFGNASIREDSDKSPDESVPRVLNLFTDNTLEFFFDQASQTTKANEYANSSTTGNKTGTPAVIPFEEVHSIWEAGAFLHSSSASSRSIFTAIDTAVPRTKLPFTADPADNVSTLRSWLDAATDTEATNIIHYVRGMDNVNFRQRTVPFPANSSLDNTTWKLGDIINSTPKIASRVPLNTYDRTYGDMTYRDFTRSSDYLKRGMVFVGANDGMLHAFKLGKLEFPGDNNWTSAGAKDRARLRNLDPLVPLGQERWAFIPKNALPYLKAMLDNNYCHLYYVDQAPQLFDASIGPATGFVADDATRTSASWRTILIGGMRFGGACRDNAATACTDCVRSPVTGNGYSSYFALDVTDPENPLVLWEFSDPALGFATTGPAVVRVNEHNADGNEDRTLNGKWYVVFGSGPTGPIADRQFFGKSDQTLKLFIVDLKTGALSRTISSFNDDTTPSTQITKAFAGSIINGTADFNLDYQDDVVYIPYIRDTSTTTTPNWDGGVVRLQTNQSRSPSNWGASVVIKGVGPVTSSVVRLQSNTYNTNWLFFGSGRYYFATPTLLDDQSTQRKLFGVKEPCFSNQNITSGCTTRVDPNTLTSIDDATAIAEGTANGTGFPGWSIDLDTTVSVNYDGTGAKNYQAERVVTDPLATSSGNVFFTTFRPYGDDCAIGGRTFLWAVRYNTGGVPAYALQGKALMQVSTASVEQLDLSEAFTRSVSGAVSSLHRGGRRSFALEGVPPTAQGLSLLSPPPPVKRILHMKER